MPESGLNFEVVVVGAGPAGIAAACRAAEAGARVAVVDDTPWLGGQIWRGEEKANTNPQAQTWLTRLRNSGAVVLGETSVVAAPVAGLLLAEHPTGPREVRWKKLIVATGARELFLPFPGWTLPGVAGPGGLLALAKNGWPVKGQKVVVAGSGPLLLACAVGLQKLGALIVSINEQAPRAAVNRFGLGLWRHPDKLAHAVQLKLALRGIPYRFGVWPASADGQDKLERVTLTDGVRTWTEQCDCLACAFGLAPNVELPLALGCALQNGFVQADEFQRTSAINIFCAGEPTGIGGADRALVEGQIAGLAAAGKQSDATSLILQRAKWNRFRAALEQAFSLRAELKRLASDDTLLCRCEDVTLGEVRQYSSWREGKLHSRCGMGACQGRICGAASKVLLGWGMESVRPPVLPARVESLVSSQ